MIFKHCRSLFRKYCLSTTVIGCIILFFCGTLTASQKTAYNIYLKKYSVMSMTNTSQSVNLKIDGESWSLSLPDKEKAAQTVRLMKFTPLAPLILLIEVFTS